MYFASIGIQQVQKHLERSRHLWGRRGASDMLFYLTDSSGVADEISKEIRGLRTVREVLNEHPDVQLNREAVDVDGVIEICGPDGTAVRAAANDLALNIKLHLPAAFVKTSVSEQDTYIGVLREEDRGLARETRTYPPVVIEFPLAHHCDECADGMASTEVPGHESRHRLCPDCAARWAGPRNKKLREARIRPQSGFMVEQMLLRELSNGNEEPKQVADFKDLATLGKLESDAARRHHTDNHIATIFADGNGLGSLFSAARRSAIESGDTTDLKELSNAIKTATKNGLKQAVKEISEAERDGGFMPAVPHILGGDDVLVSVPATRMWSFLLTFMEAMKGELAAHSLLNGTDVSFSAGVVICHQAFPIGDQVELADELMRKAKRAVNGQGWSFAWRDVTNEGVDVTDRVFTLEDWEGLQELIEAAKHLGGGDKKHGNAARNNVREELMIPDEHARTLHLRHLADRLDGAAPLFDRAFGPNWRERSAAESPVTATQTHDLLAALSIMRWQQ